MRRSTDLGSGPRMPDEKYPVPLNVRISAELSERLTRKANQDRRTVSSLVRRVLHEWAETEESVA